MSGITSVKALCSYASVIVLIAIFNQQTSAQTLIHEEVKPDARRIAFASKQSALEQNARPNSYQPQRPSSSQIRVRDAKSSRTFATERSNSATPNAVTNAITAGTP